MLRWNICHWIGGIYLGRMQFKVTLFIYDRRKVRENGVLFIVSLEKGNNVALESQLGGFAHWNFSL